MLKPEILNHRIVSQQGKNPSEIDEEPLKPGRRQETEDAEHAQPERTHVKF
jgi:hypothetical protein